MQPPDDHPSVTLKEYFEALFQALKDNSEAVIREVDRRYEQRADLQDKAVAAALASAQKAVDAALAAQDAAVSKAEKQDELWRASANEWRSAMNDRETKFATQEMLTGLEQRVRENTDRLRTIEARKEGMGSGWTYLGQFVALAAAVIAIVFSILK
jgi:chemotaxis protein histidine kinase CheA